MNPSNNKTSDWNKILALAIFTIIYNLAEGIVSLFFGLQDDTLALLGFGIDSFVEVISGIGILHLVFRLRKNQQDHQRDIFERTALRITAISFYLLTLGLVAGVILNLIHSTTPQSTLPGTIISFVSVLSMYFLMRAKIKLGKRVESDAVIADGHCTRTCLYLSLVLLASAGLYLIWRIPYLDLAGSLGIAWLSFREGREAWGKAQGNALCGCLDKNCQD